MKKAVLSLTTAFSLFLGAPVYAFPVVDFLPEALVSPAVTHAEPQIKIVQDAHCDPESVCFIDGRNLPLMEDQGETLSNFVNRGETKRFQCFQLAKGQKITATIDWVNKYFSDGSEENGFDALVNRGFKPIQRVEKRIEEDGFYAIELVAPSEPFDVSGYSVIYHIEVE